MQSLNSAFLDYGEKFFDLGIGSFFNRKVPMFIFNVNRNSIHEEERNKVIMAIVSSTVHGCTYAVAEAQTTPCLEQILNDFIVA
jgi:hypothetical protein